MSKDFLEGLNPFQKEAVITTEGPLVCVAGAGSGKTRVLTHRIAYLNQVYGVPLENILALTFTNKAAREMKERVSVLVGQETRNMWISTFHSFCARLLRQIITYAPNRKKSFMILDDDDALAKIRRILKDNNIDTKLYSAQRIQNVISNIKNEEYFESKNEAFNQVVKLVYDLYEEELLKENLLDFDDLIKITLEILTNNPEVLDHFQNTFQYILIDEFQDTNKIQYKLIRLLGMKYKNVFIVGDQDQSIYSFRGARVENFDYFIKDFHNPKIITLEQNYRSTENILRAANNIIKNNKKRLPKNLFTKNKGGSNIYYYVAESGFDEASFVVNRIKDLVEHDGYKYSDFAVMYRMNSLSREYEDALLKYQIPYVVFGGVSFFQRKEVKDILSYIRLMYNPDDDFSFKRIVNVPSRKIGDTTITKLSNIANENKCSLFKAIELSSGDLRSSVQASLFEFRNLIYSLREDFNKQDLSNLIDNILVKTGYKTMLEENEDDERLDNILELKSNIQEAVEFYEGDNEEILASFLQDVSLRTDLDIKTKTDNYVSIMTFHQAKGLEFRVVFLAALEDGIFPSAQGAFEDPEEERRIAYVGVTRAKETLFLLRATARRLYGETTYNPPSRYLKEIGYENYQKVTKFNFERNYKPTLKFNDQGSSNEDTFYNIGDKVEHKMFGIGTIVQIKDSILVISFNAPYGIKNIMKNHPSIRKIGVS